MGQSWTGMKAIAQTYGADTWTKIGNSSDIWSRHRKKICNSSDIWSRHLESDLRDMGQSWTEMKAITQTYGADTWTKILEIWDTAGQ
ncbi:hypothetical protein PoB_003004200 [Plakobranchus ocellatus]|uniref:Uncharacterized protein n=1 Tax=Plakobranchus ocellatus TaxID=259542 RepID=A0AAV4A9F3_9GAST|nr:hypothetical protein PoB_003004200 [Plakobranchus ocellatus]